MLESLTNWLREQFSWLWHHFVSFMQWLCLYCLKELLSAVTWVINHIPLPSFVTDHSLNSLLGQSGSTILWYVDLFQIPASLAVIGAGTLFFFLRRILTIGIW